MKESEPRFGDEFYRLRRQSRLSARAVSDASGCSFLYLGKLENSPRLVLFLDRFEPLLRTIGAVSQSNRLASIAAGSRGRLIIRPNRLPYDRALLAVQFGRKLHRLPEDAVRRIAAIVDEAGDA